MWMFSAKCVHPIFPTSVVQRLHDVPLEKSLFTEVDNLLEHARSVHEHYHQTEYQIQHIYGMTGTLSCSTHPTGIREHHARELPFEGNMSPVTRSFPVDVTTFHANVKTSIPAESSINPQVPEFAPAG
jgi:hypothetical protein